MIKKLICRGYALHTMTRTNILKSIRYQPSMYAFSNKVNTLEQIQDQLHDLYRQYDSTEDLSQKVKQWQDIIQLKQSHTNTNQSHQYEGYYSDQLLLAKLFEQQNKPEETQIILDALLNKSNQLLQEFPSSFIEKFQFISDLYMYGANFYLTKLGIGQSIMLQQRCNELQKYLLLQEGVIILDPEQEFNILKVAQYKIEEIIFFCNLVLRNMFNLSKLFRKNTEYQKALEITHEATFIQDRVANIIKQYVDSFTNNQANKFNSELTKEKAVSIFQQFLLNQAENFSILGFVYSKLNLQKDSYEYFEQAQYIYEFMKEATQLPETHPNIIYHEIAELYSHQQFGDEEISSRIKHLEDIFSSLKQLDGYEHLKLWFLQFKLSYLSLDMVVQDDIRKQINQILDNPNKDPFDEIINNQSEIQNTIRQEKYPEAINLLDQQIQLLSNLDLTRHHFYFDSHVLKGNILRLQKRILEAIQIYEHVLGVPNLSDSQRFLAQHEQAKNYFEQFLLTKCQDSYEIQRKAFQELKELSTALDKKSSSFDYTLIVLESEAEYLQKCGEPEKAISNLTIVQNLIQDNFPPTEIKQEMLKKLNQRIVDLKK